MAINQCVELQHDSARALPRAKEYCVEPPNHGGVSSLTLRTGSAIFLVASILFGILSAIDTWEKTDAQTQAPYLNATSPRSSRNFGIVVLGVVVHLPTPSRRSPEDGNGKLIFVFSRRWGRVWRSNRSRHGCRQRRDLRPAPSVLRAFAIAEGFFGGIT